MMGGLGWCYHCRAQESIYILVLHQFEEFSSVTVDVGIDLAHFYRKNTYCLVDSLIKIVVVETYPACWRASTPRDFEAEAKELEV